MENPHELMRAIEARNIWLCVKMHLVASRFRKESRPHPRSFLGHCRTAYPDANVELDKPVVIRKKKDEMELVWTDKYQPTTAWR